MQEPMGSGMVMVGADGGNGTFVSGEQLKQADVPVETLLGAANGALSGAIVSSAVSAAVTVASHNRALSELGEPLGKMIIKNITSNHLIAVLSGTAAFAALGALVRHSRATKHNEWSERHYAYLEQQAGKSFTEREDAAEARNAAAMPQR